MLKRNLRRALGAAAVTTALIVGSAAAAHANPAPDNGPVAGGTTVAVPAPVLTFTEISAGGLHTLAIGSDGNTYAWGWNLFGQLGDGTNTDSTAPVRVQAPAGVTFTRVSAGDQHSLALGDDGNTYAWGYNNNGQLGNGTNTDSSVPVQVSTGGVTLEQIDAGSTHSLALGDDGNAYAWGFNAQGQLGNGTNTDSNVPVQVSTGGVTLHHISTRGYYSVALGNDGNAYAWGANTSGQLGNGTNTNSNVPVAIQRGGVGYLSIEAGDFHAVALGDDGNTYAWGQNTLGQLGNGTNTDSNVPVAVQTGGTAYTRISIGGAHTLAYDAAGNLYAWGMNNAGQLGNGTTANSNLPVSFSPPAGVTFAEVSAGALHSAALGVDGNVYEWGQIAGTSNTAPTLFAPIIVVTGVTFDGLAGASLTDNGDGTWSVDTPAHSAGPVDVVVSWTLNGVAQTPVTYTDGFTYYAPAAPTITNPADQTVTTGGTATFTVTATGAPTPTVVWEVSRDGGSTWEPITADPDATPNGSSLDVVGSATNDGYQYRATATNSEGDATSQGATLTVNPVPVAPTITDPADRTVKQGDTATFTVTTTGTPTPTVVWEVSRDGGTTWEAITADPAATPSGSGLTLSVVGTAANDGYLYRATATNSEGSVTSQPAKLTVTKPAGNGGDDPKKDDEVNKRLSNTGMESTPFFWIAGAIALLLGGGLIAGNRVVNRRMKS
ncbi:MAG: hypothetical protein ACK5LO_03060 [Leucobacter sp.]